MENLQEPEKRSCAVCAHPLHVVVPQGGEEPRWVHAELDWADHPAVPVAPGEVHTAHRCDFCSTEEPSWVLPTRTFASGEFAVPGAVFDTASGENFAACDTCARLVETNQWNALVRRVATIVLAKHCLTEDMRQVIEPGLKDFYRKLRKNITGGLRPLKEDS